MWHCKFIECGISEGGEHRRKVKAYEFKTIKTPPSDIRIRHIFILNEASSSPSHRFRQTGRHKFLILVKKRPCRVLLTPSSNSNSTTRHRSTCGVMVLARLRPNGLSPYAWIASLARVNVCCNEFNSSSMSRWLFPAFLRSINKCVIWTIRPTTVSTAETVWYVVLRTFPWDKVSKLGVSRGRSLLMLRRCWSVCPEPDAERCTWMVWWLMMVLLWIWSRPTSLKVLRLASVYLDFLKAIVQDTMKARRLGGGTATLPATACFSWRFGWCNKQRLSCTIKRWFHRNSRTYPFSSHPSNPDVYLHVSFPQSNRHWLFLIGTLRNSPPPPHLIR